jgi:hypothetical protein
MRDGAFRLAAFVVLALLGACGGTPGPCAGPSDGSWVGTASDALVLSESCDFLYTGTDGCRSTGTYGAALGASGTVQIDITSATSGQCLPAGSYVCAYQASGSALSFDCGAGVQTYGR